MPIILLCFFIGSLILALLISWQIKTVPADLLSIAKFYLYTSPILIISNSLLSYGFAQAHNAIKNLPAAIAGQTLIYFLCILGVSLWLLNDKISIIHSIIGILLIVSGIYVLKMS